MSQDFYDKAKELHRSLSSNLRRYHEMMGQLIERTPPPKAKEAPKPKPKKAPKNAKPEGADADSF